MSTMMLADSVRRGNIFLFPGAFWGTYIGYVQDVDHANGFGVPWVFISKAGGKKTVKLRSTQLQAVPITKDRLRALGFTRMEDLRDSKIYKKKPIWIEFNAFAPAHPIVRLGPNTECFDVKYIHQLQNLYCSEVGAELVQDEADLKALLRKLKRG